MNRNLKIALLVIAAVSGAIGSIGYQAKHADSWRDAIAGAAKGAQDRMRTLTRELEQLAADDSASTAEAGTWLVVPPVDTMRQYRAQTLEVTDRRGWAHAAAWTSSDTTVLVVSQAGRVEAVGPGVATVTAETRDGRLLRAEIVVEPDD